MEIPFHGRFSKQSFNQAVAQISRPSTRNAIYRIGLSVLVTAIFIAYSVMIFFKEEQTGFELARVTRHFIALPFFLYYLLKPYLSAFTTAKQLWKNPSIQGIQTGSISSQGICFGSDPSHHELGGKSSLKNAKMKSYLLSLRMMAYSLPYHVNSS